MATQAPNDPTAPITPARFAAALKDLPLASLHLKVLELRNALLHLAHSNAQLRPFADGTETSLDLAPGTPDPDCVDAIRENTAVMARMRARIELVKAEVVGRGVSWREFEAVGDDETDEPGVVAGAPAVAAVGGSRPLTNGVHNEDEATDAASAAAPLANNTNGTTTATSHGAASSTTTASNPWTDGTFQMGTIRNGELHMDSAPPQRPNGTTTSSTAAPSQNGSGGGGRLTDEELRRLLELRLAEDAGGDEEDGGLHL